MPASDLTPDYLHQIFSYSPHDGLLRWKVKRCNSIHVGKIAGSVSKRGYRNISIDDKTYRAHRIIWLMVTGAWPKDQLDHINGKRADNRIANLREASTSLNHQNKRRSRSDNRIGILGVSMSRKSFAAQIMINGRTHFLGRFPTAELAHAAYLEAKRKLHPGNTL